MLLDRYDHRGLGDEGGRRRERRVWAPSPPCSMGDGDDDPLFLQVKQAEASVLERVPDAEPPAEHGERVVTGQRRLQAVSDILLGWIVGEQGRHWYVRQLQDQKAGAVIEAMTIDDLTTWGELCAWALARGHARSGDPPTIAAYLGDGRGVRATRSATSPTAYADQTERDLTRHSRPPSRAAGSRPRRGSEVAPPTGGPPIRRLLGFGPTRALRESGDDHD